MANQITADGIETYSYDELVAIFQAGYRAIYGDDIIVDANSPDGQLIGIFAQIIVDSLGLSTQIYSQFDPDQAIGTTLDARCALNGVKRLGGTFSTVEVLVTVDRALTLTGLGNDINDPDGTGYTVSDNEGNQWILTNASYVFSGAGSQLLTFRAQNSGAILSTPNTITVPVTIVIGVTTVNNPNPALSTGLNQETDAQLRIRRQISVAIPAQSWADSLRAALLNVNGVTSAQVNENDTDSTNGAGIPSHSIWVIVEGGSDDDIANAIYAKRNAGCGMYGDEEVTISRVNGRPITIKFSRTSTERLYAKFTLNTISSDISVSGATITSGSKIVTGITTTASMAIGQLIQSSYFAFGTTIESIDSDHQIHASANATGSGSTMTVVPIVVSEMKTALAAAIVPGIDQTVNIGQITTAAQIINTSALPTFPANQGFSSDNATFTAKVSPSALNKKFTLASGDIAIG